MKMNEPVARIWRGQTPVEKKDSYAKYLYEQGVLELKRLGAREVFMFTRDDGDVCNFMVLSLWPDIATMQKWSGDTPAATRHLDDDADILLELPPETELLEIRYVEKAD